MKKYMEDIYIYIEKRGGEGREDRYREEKGSK